jgi:hypothetical protein
MIGFNCLRLILESLTQGVCTLRLAFLRQDLLVLNQMSGLANICKNQVFLQLTELDLSCSYETDCVESGFMEAIANTMPKLTSLNLSFRQITGEAVQTLCARLTKLRYLSFTVPRCDLLNRFTLCNQLGLLIFLEQLTLFEISNAFSLYVTSGNSIAMTYVEQLRMMLFDKVTCLKICNLYAYGRV